MELTIRGRIGWFSIWFFSNSRFRRFRKSFIFMIIGRDWSTLTSASNCRVNVSRISWMISNREWTRAHCCCLGCCCSCCDDGRLSSCSISSENGLDGIGNVVVAVRRVLLKLTLIEIRISTDNWAFIKWILILKMILKLFCSLIWLINYDSWRHILTKSIWIIILNWSTIGVSSLVEVVMSPIVPIYIWMLMSIPCVMIHMMSHLILFSTGWITIWWESKITEWKFLRIFNFLANWNRKWSWILSDRLEVRFRLDYVDLQVV